MSFVRLTLCLGAMLLAQAPLRAQSTPVRSELLGMVMPESTTATRSMLYREAAKYAQQLDASRLHRTLGARQEVFRLVLSAPAQAEFLATLQASGWAVATDPVLATAAIVEKPGSAPLLLTFDTRRKERWIYAAEIAPATASVSAPPDPSPQPRPAAPTRPTTAPPLTSAPTSPTSPASAVPSAPPPAPGTGSFAFTTTNFDDGWTSRITPDFVTITKGPITVVQHYKREEENAYMSVLEEQTRLFWQLLVAPRYRDVANLVVERNNPGGYQPINYASATATDIASGRRVFIVLFSHPNRNTRWMEFVSPDQATFEREFGPYRGSDTQWDRWIAMAGRNRFAVAPSDFVGTWSDNFASGTSMVFSATGRAAGMLYAGGNTTVTFGNGAYVMDVAGGTGMVGSIRMQNITYKGAFSVVDNWTIAFANNFEGRTRRFRASFEGIRDGRVLNLVLDEPGAPITLHMIRIR